MRMGAICQRGFRSLSSVLWANFDQSSRSFESITICLYWREFEDEKVRRLIEDMGFEVTTLGHRDDNPGFVSRLRTLILAHEYVSTNSYSTALFYSLFLNRKTFVYGNTFVSRLLPGKTDNLSIHDAMRQRYPQLDWESFDDTSHQDIGADEIGAVIPVITGRPSP